MVEQTLSYLYRFEKQSQTVTRVPEYIRRDILTPAQPRSAYDFAVWLHDQGLSVMPLPYGQKTHAGNGRKGLQWAELTRARFARDDLKFLWPDQPRNLAVVCGYSGLFVLDYDDPAIFDHAQKTLRMHNISTVIVNTGGGGGHIYFTCDTTPAAVKTTWGDVKAGRAYVVGPGSVHPDTGRRYELHPDSGQSVHKLSSLDELAFLIRLQPAQTGKQHGQAARDYIRNGDNIPEGRRNNSLFAAAVDTRNAGVSRDRAHATLTGPARASGLGASEVQATINSAYSHSRNTGKHDRLAHLQAFAQSHNWQGRTRHTDKAVYLALVERWRLDATGTGSFRASQRELKELTGIRKPNTIENALRRLQDAGLLHCAKSGRREARRWWFDKAVWDSSPTAIEISFFRAEVAKGISKTAVLRHACSDTLCNFLCCNQQATATEIVQATGFHKSTVSRALKSLIADGLVSRASGRPARYSLTQAGIDAIPDIEQMHQERLDSLKAQHATDRAVWLATRFMRWFATYDPAPEKPPTVTPPDVKWRNARPVDNDFQSIGSVLALLVPGLDESGGVTECSKDC